MADKLKALKAGGYMKFFGNKMPKCPHCGDDFDIERNEAWFLYDENGPHEVDCPRCNEAFSVSSLANWSFSTDEQDEDG